MQMRLQFHCKSSDNSVQIKVSYETMEKVPHGHRKRHLFKCMLTANFCAFYRLKLFTVLGIAFYRKQIDAFCFSTMPNSHTLFAASYFYGVINANDFEFCFGVVTIETQLIDADMCKIFICKISPIEQWFGNSRMCEIQTSRVFSSMPLTFWMWSLNLICFQFNGVGILSCVMRIWINVQPFLNNSKWIFGR